MLEDVDRQPDGAAASREDQTSRSEEVRQREGSRMGPHACR